MGRDAADFEGHGRRLIIPHPRCKSPGPFGWGFFLAEIFIAAVFETPLERETLARSQEIDCRFCSGRNVRHSGMGELL
jgi:hypothetical protein